MAPDCRYLHNRAVGTGLFPESGRSGRALRQSAQRCNNGRLASLPEYEKPLGEIFYIDKSRIIARPNVVHVTANTILLIVHLRQVRL